MTHDCVNLSYGLNISTVFFQPSGVISGVNDGYWTQGTPGFQNNTVNAVQSNVRTPIETSPMYGGFQEHKTEYPHAANAQFQANHQVPQNYHTSLPSIQQTVSQTVQQPALQTVTPLDLRVSTMQIPANPRIATNLTLGLPKSNKENPVSSLTAKPAYVSVAPPKTNDAVSSHDTADSLLKVRLCLLVDIISYFFSSIYTRYGD